MIKIFAIILIFDILRLATILTKVAQRYKFISNIQIIPANVLIFKQKAINKLH